MTPGRGPTVVLATFWLWIMLPAAAQPLPSPFGEPVSPVLLEDPQGLDSTPSFRIVFDGRTGGVSSGRMEMGFGDIVFDYLERKGGRIVDVRSSLGALYRDAPAMWVN